MMLADHVVCRSPCRCRNDARMKNQHLLGRIGVQVYVDGIGTLIVTMWPL